MKVRVKYMAQLKRAAGVDAEERDIEAGCTVQALVCRLADQQTIRGMLLDADARPLRALLVFVGDEQVPPDSTRLLRDNDEVTLLTPMAGG